MSNYTKATNFAIKDGLVTTDPAKIIKGTEIDNEYNAISNAIASKADTNSPALTGTPTAPTATTGSNTTQLATTAFVRTELTTYLPSGVILLWSGSVASIPSGWVLCNGSNSTPDLRNRFVVGAGSTYSVGNTGGSADAIVVNHSHTASSSSSVSDSGHSHGVSDPGHAHGIPFGPRSGSSVAVGDSGGGAAPIGTYGATTGISIQSAGTGISVSTSTSVASYGNSGTNANLPPYYALAYIMKS